MLFNVRELAVAAGVSPSAVVRFARELGYEGFQSFKDYLQHTVRARLSAEFFATNKRGRCGEKINVVF